ncbi:MAG: hypothetical protein ACLPGW_11275 [Roseiarcus sp.]
MRSLAVLTTALLLSLGGSSQATCRFEFATLHFGFENPVKGDADSGKACGFSVSAAGQTGVGSFRIARPPQHGVAGLAEDSGMPVVGYRSAAGYRGPDEFVVTFVGGNARVQAMATSVHVYLDVR